MNCKTSLVVVIVLVSVLSWTASSAVQEQTVQTPVDQQQTLPKDQEAFNVTNLTKGLSEGDFWLVLLVTLIVGSAGGIVYELLILQRNIEKPHKPTAAESEEKFPYAIYQHMYDLGILARMIIGALAAVVGLWIFNPNTTFSWLAIAVVSGSAGTSVFRSMQDRLLAAMAQKDVTDLKRSLKLQASKLNELKQNLEAQPNQPPTPRAFEILSEAKGVSDPWA
jgi:hypothetical protein